MKEENKTSSGSGTIEELFDGFQPGKRFTQSRIDQYDKVLKSLPLPEINKALAEIKVPKINAEIGYKCLRQAAGAIVRGQCGEFVLGPRYDTLLDELAEYSDAELKYLKKIFGENTFEIISKSEIRPLLELLKEDCQEKAEKNERLYNISEKLRQSENDGGLPNIIKTDLKRCGWKLNRKFLPDGWAESLKSFTLATKDKNPFNEIHKKDMQWATGFIRRHPETTIANEIKSLSPFYFDSDDTVVDVEAKINHIVRVKRRNLTSKNTTSNGVELSLYLKSNIADSSFTNSCILSQIENLAEIKKESDIQAYSDIISMLPTDLETFVNSNSDFFRALPIDTFNEYRLCEEGQRFFWSVALKEVADYCAKHHRLPDDDEKGYYTGIFLLSWLKRHKKSPLKDWQNGINDIEVPNDVESSNNELRRLAKSLENSTDGIPDARNPIAGLDFNQWHGYMARSIHSLDPELRLMFRRFSDTTWYSLSAIVLECWRETGLIPDSDLEVKGIKLREWIESLFKLDDEGFLHADRSLELRRFRAIPAPSPETIKEYKYIDNGPVPELAKKFVQGKLNTDLKKRLASCNGVRFESLIKAVVSEVGEARLSAARPGDKKLEAIFSDSKEFYNRCLAECKSRKEYLQWAIEDSKIPL